MTILGRSAIKRDLIESHHEVEWYEVKEEFTKTVLELIDTPLLKNDQNALGYVQEYLREDGQSEWTGCTKAEMKKWLRDGFSSPEFDLIEDYTPTRKSRRQISAEEGQELLIDAALSGDPAPWRQWEDRPRKPGLRIAAEIFFNAGNNPKIGAQYGAWLAGLIQGLEQKGYDLEVVLTLSQRKLWVGDRENIHSQTSIALTRENEQSDFIDFSPMFSPGGLRMLGFFALMMHCKAEKKKVTSYFSYPTKRGSEWLASFDDVTRELRIEPPDNPTFFDGEQMSEAVGQISDLLN